MILHLKRYLIVTREENFMKENQTDVTLQADAPLKNETELSTVQTIAGQNSMEQTGEADRPKAVNEQNDFIMLPTVDFCFKELMRNENVRKSIIAAILNIHPGEVEEAKLIETILRKEYEDDKYGVLDVRVKLKGGAQIDFEMQVVYFEYWENRTLFYLSKMYTDQIKEGDNYDVLKKCIQVSIFDHIYFKDDDRCYRRITFRDDQLKKEYTDLMEIHILELPKIPKEQQNETDLVKWMRFLGGKKREDFKKMAEKNPEMKEAYDTLDRISADEEKRLEYEARQKMIRDHNMILKTAQHRFEKGLQEGREKGLQEGREKGLQEGREKGLQEGRAEGRAEERNRINQLNVKLVELQRTDDILKAATDEEYQKKLLKEFGLES